MTKWHISSATHTSFWTQQKNKANVSDPSEVRGNITIIFKRIKTDPQILFSILMSNLIAIMRIKSLGSLLRWLQPQNTTVKNLQFKFSFYSFKKKIHCCLDRQGSMGFFSCLTVPAELPLRKVTASSTLAASQAPVSVRQVRVPQWHSIIFCYFSFQL